MHGRLFNQNRYTGRAAMKYRKNGGMAMINQARVTQYLWTSQIDSETTLSGR
jgi:hypothetical protein